MKFFLPSGLLLLLLAGLLLSGACKKASRDGELYGNWELTYYSAGFSGIVIHPGPDSVCILSLQGDHGYRRTVNGNVNEFGTYSTSTTTIGGEKMPDILFNGETGTPPGEIYDGPVREVINTGMIYSLNKDTLMMGMGVVDGPEYRYVRVR